LRKAVSDTKNQFCYSCYTGRYPTDLVGIEQLVTEHREKG
jgi:amidophosphoribosyltransferase